MDQDPPSPTPRTPGPASVTARWAIVAGLWAVFLGILTASGNAAEAIVPLAIFPLVAGGILFGWRIGAVLAAAAIPLAWVTLLWTNPDAHPLPEATWMRWGLGLGLAVGSGAAAELLQRASTHRDALQEEAKRRAVVEDELRQAAAKYRALADNSPDLISRFDRNHKRLYANPTVAELEGQPRDALVGKGLSPDELPPLPKGTLENFITTMDGVFRDGKPATLELDGPSTKGIRRFETRLFPEFDAQGGVETVLVVSRDVTDARRAAARLETANRNLRAMIDSSPMAIVQRDPDGLVRFWNPAAERLFGWPATDVVGKPDPVAQTSEPPMQTAAGKSAVSAHMMPSRHVKARDGTVVPVDAYLAPILDEAGRLSAMMTIYVDLRERLAAQKVDALAAENVERERFLSTAAHELATPLTPIRAQIAALHIGLDERLSKAEQKGFDLVSRNLDRFTRLVQDLLDTTRLQAGRLRMRRQVIRIDVLATEVVQSIEAKAHDDGIAVAVNAPLGLEVEGDQMRLQQVMLNLVQNAVKFTPRGGLVAIEVTGAADGVDIEVRDTGIGMKPDEAATLFQPFVRLAQAEPKPGTGLGLFICKGIVEQHGGTVMATSPGVGLGSTFAVHLPTHPPESLTASAAA